LLKQKEIKIIVTTAVMLFVSVQLLQNFMPFGSEERVNFYFSQMAFVQLLFAYSLFRLMKSWITFFWVFYVVGELINEVFFKGSLSYIEIIMGATSLFYYYYKHGRKRNR
tara:strand:+ start:106 stop:435 length:330 start_codon:yes stop_codon:yes gene_type:complete